MHEDMLALRALVFPGVDWTDSERTSRGREPRPSFSFNQIDSGFICRVELNWQGAFYFGESGEIGFGSKTGLTGAQLAAECDLIRRYLGGMSFSEGLRRARLAASHLQIVPSSRERSSSIVASAPKRRKLAVSAEESTRSRILHILDAARTMLSGSDFAIRREIPCARALFGFLDRGIFHELASFASVKITLSVDFAKLDLVFLHSEAEVELGNLFRCVSVPLLAEATLSSELEVSIFFRLHQNPKITELRGNVKRRLGDFFGRAGFWQDISVIKIDIDPGAACSMLNILLLQADNGSLALETDPSRFIPTEPASLDLASWIPTAKATLPFSVPFPIAFQLASIMTQRLLPPRPFPPSLLQRLAELKVDSLDMDSMQYLHAPLFLGMQEYAHQDAISFEGLSAHIKDLAATAPLSCRRENCFWVPHIVVTPTRIICTGILPEMGNRMLRHFSKISDSMGFLRVSFRDETGRLSKAFSAGLVRRLLFPFLTTLTALQVESRLRPVFEQGIQVPYSGRKYDFLMFSSAQLRQHNAWFVWQPAGSPPAESIRKWVGKLDHIKTPSKFASRLGLVLSSSVATVPVPREVARMVGVVPDVVRNGCIFSDGVGVISPSLAEKVAASLGLLHCPSAFQIRYSGAKGMLTLHPDLGHGDQMRLRPSMLKFESAHEVLEILSWSRPQPAFLNRQLIAVLSSRGIDDSVFLNLQRACLNDEMSMPSAFSKSIRPVASKRFRALSGCGFPPSHPYFAAGIEAIRSSRLRELRRSSRIPVAPDQGRNLLGVLDEYGILEYGEIFLSVSEDIEDPLSVGRVVVGDIIVARSPTLFPGDIRILRAVDHFRLHHLKNCVVFPQKGPRPHPSECSGGDLDGDMFLCIWSSDLIPKDEDRAAAPANSHSTSKAMELDRVTSADLSGVFLSYVHHDYLGAIADAWV